VQSPVTTNGNGPGLVCESSRKVFAARTQGRGNPKDLHGSSISVADENHAGRRGLLLKSNMVLLDQTENHTENTRNLHEQN